MLRIKLGCTRLVVLSDGYAYKIARIRPLKVLLKLLAISVLTRQCWDLQNRYHHDVLIALWRYLFAGWYANQAELQHWQCTRDERCVPVVGSFLGGLVIVQARADPVTMYEVQNSSVGFCLTKTELAKPHQYGWFEGKVRIVDYAHWRLWPMLMPGE
tara:strand:- start:93 stop:563 length:471 start_codon:yes stop_codon:yes gene_type:complete